MTTKELARFINVTEYHQLPERVVEQAKLCFLDFLSVTLRGSLTNSAEIVRKTISDGDESTVIGGHSSNPLDASLANGVSAHSLDLDDGHRLAQLHPGACVIPAALSLSEARDKSGKEFITALVVGYQVAIRLGMLVNPGHRWRGFHSTGTCGTMGAAAAACKIMDLDENYTLNALGLAGTQAAGLLVSDHSGSMAKHLHAGRAAQSGVLSALLASEGFTGAHDIIESEEGLISAMGDPEQDYKYSYGHNSPMDSYPSSSYPSSINDYTRSEFDMISSTNSYTSSGSTSSGDSHPPSMDSHPPPVEYDILHIYFKKYPVCRHLHSAIDATTHIMASNKIEITDIIDITVKTYRIAADHQNYRPKTREAIQQSLPASLAIVVGDGCLNLENMRMNREITEISHKVIVKCDEDLDELYPLKRPSEVTIKTKTNSYTLRVDLARGEPENPFNKYDLVNKFLDLNPGVDRDVLKNLESLESLKMRDFMEELNQGFKVE
jgi:2-methylcitrate dehydratase PrpD